MTNPVDSRTTVEVVLTAACNLRCRYCFQNAKSARRARWTTVRAAVDLLLSSRSRELRLGFYGGEPLLELPTMRRAVAYAMSRRSPGKSLSFSVVTNGTLLDERAARFLVRHRFSTWLSFDGLPAAQELRGRGTFRRLDALIDRLRVEHPTWFREDLRIGVVLTAATIPYLAASVAYFRRKGVRAIDVAPVITHDAGWTDLCRDVLRRQLDRVFRLSLRHFDRTGEIPFSCFRRGRSRDEPRAGRASKMCGVGRPSKLTVDVDARVYPCPVLARSGQRYGSTFLQERLEPLCLGDLKHRRFRERLAHLPERVRAAEIFDHKEAKYSSYGRCGDCRHADACSPCPLSIGHIPGNSDPRRIPDFVCAFNMLVGEYRERFPREPDAIDFLTGTDRLPILMQELGRYVNSRRAGTAERTP